VVEASAYDEREIAVDPSFLEEARDGVIDTGKHAAPRKTGNRQVLGVRVVVPSSTVSVSLRKRRAGAACR
jgi:hypothetical protein